MSTETSTSTTDESSSTPPEDVGLEQVKMGFLEHLGELRRRIVYSLIAVGLAFGLCWFFVTDIFDFFLQPLILAAPEEQLAQMHQADLAEAFFTLLKTAGVAAVFVASPAILYNIWKFVAPGLYPNEKKAVLPFILMGTLFFFLGASFCYLLVIPFGYAFLFDFGGQVAEPILMIDQYFALTTKLLLAFGIVFELPVATYFLSAIGILTHEILIKQWRIAVVVSFLLAAVLTPPDVITQAMLAGPLILLYGFSILIAWYQTRRRQKEADAETL